MVEIVNCVPHACLKECNLAYVSAVVSNMTQRKAVEKCERDLGVKLVKVFSEEGKRVEKVKCS